MTSITSKPFNGQLGDAEQNSDINLAAGYSLNLRRGSGVVELHCQNNQEKLEIYSDGYGGYRDLGCRSSNFTGSIDIESLLNSWTAKNWVLNV